MYINFSQKSIIKLQETKFKLLEYLKINFTEFFTELRLQIQYNKYQNFSQNFFTKSYRNLL